MLVSKISVNTIRRLTLCLVVIVLEEVRIAELVISDEDRPCIHKESLVMLSLALSKK